MKIPSWEKLRGWLFFDVDQEDRAADRSSYERFALPYSFKPRLSVLQASVAALIAFLRIFMSSLLFAFWGTYSLLALIRIRNIFWRLVAVPPLLLLFALLLGSLMFALSALARLLHRHPQRKVA